MLKKIRSNSGKSFQKYRSNASAKPIKNMIRIKTERGIKTKSGIKVEHKITPETQNESERDEWNREKKVFISKISALQKENHTVTLKLKKKEADCEALKLEKQQSSQQIRSLSTEVSASQSELIELKTEFSKQKSLHAKALSDLKSENRLLQAQMKQLRTGMSRQKSFDASRDNIENEYEVEMLVAHKQMKDGMRFRVRWLGYGEADDTWERESNLSCLKILNEYKRKMNLK